MCRKLCRQRRAELNTAQKTPADLSRDERTAISASGWRCRHCRHHLPHEYLELSVLMARITGEKSAPGVEASTVGQGFWRRGRAVFAIIWRRPNLRLIWMSSVLTRSVMAVRPVYRELRSVARAY